MAHSFNFSKPKLNFKDSVKSCSANNGSQLVMLKDDALYQSFIDQFLAWCSSSNTCSEKVRIGLYSNSSFGYPRLWVDGTQVTNEEVLPITESCKDLCPGCYNGAFSTSDINFTIEMTPCQDLLPFVCFSTADRSNDKLLAYSASQTTAANLTPSQPAVVYWEAAVIVILVLLVVGYFLTRLALKKYRSPSREEEAGEVEDVYQDVIIPGSVRRLHVVQEPYYADTVTPAVPYQETADQANLHYADVVGHNPDSYYEYISTDVNESNRYRVDSCHSVLSDSLATGDGCPQGDNSEQQLNRQEDAYVKMNKP